MKKRIIVISIVIIIILGIKPVSNLITLKKFQKVTDEYIYIKDFEKYKEDFEKINHVVMNHKKELEEKHSYLIVDFKEGKPYLAKSDNFKLINLTREETISLLNIYDAFEAAEGEFSQIKVYQNKVVYQIENARFEIVYSVDGNKPEYLGESNDEEYYYTVQRLSENWYSVMGTLR